jgi:sugar/nucleoside kinase (ribokinase family)
MYANRGAELAAVMRRAKQYNLTTSLDMAMPGQSSEAYTADWRSILKTVLPDVDFFMPSLEEMLIMLHRDQYMLLLKEDKQAFGLNDVGIETVRRMADEIIQMGCAVFALKMGESGLYVRSGPTQRMRQVPLPAFDAAAWTNRECWSPCFKTHVAGTTGAGDSTIAGFLAAIMKGFSIEETMTFAVAVGACNVEAEDATSGIVSWDEVQERIRGAWERLDECCKPPSDWRWDNKNQIWYGPTDPNT